MESTKQRSHGLKNVILCFMCMLFIATLSFAETNVNGRKHVVLQSKSAYVGTDLGGGGIVDFHIQGHGLNPLTWTALKEGDLKSGQMGHFICFDRWGPSSESEADNGILPHGEATYQTWEVLTQPTVKSNGVMAEVFVKLPVTGLTLKRTMMLSQKAAVLEVQEEITNTNKVGRVYNIVQHPSIAPPFLDETVVVDTNAGKGLMQESPMPEPEKPVVYWPTMAYKGTLVDMRRLINDHNPNVVSYVFEDDVEQGWVTACNPGKTLLIGYIWELSDYPWLSLWRNMSQDKPGARGLEFGTTGLHQPYPVLFAKNEIFGERLMEYINAGQKITKSYTAFLAEIPKDFNGVGDVTQSKGRITITERAPGSRVINIAY